MKITYCFESFCVVGGAERIVADKANYLHDKFGYDITIVIENQHDKNTGELKAPFYKLSDGIKLVDFNLDLKKHNEFGLLRWLLIERRKERMKYQRKLQQYVNEYKPDIVISIEGMAKEVLPYIKGNSVKIMEEHLTVNGTDVTEEEGKGRFVKMLYRLRRKYLICKSKRYDKIVVLTKADKKDWERTNKNIVQIYNFTDIKPKVSDLSSKRFIAAGRLLSQKGFDLLIPIWRKVADKHPDWCIDIFGEGEWQEMLQDMINDYGLEDNVFLKGVSNHIADEYACHYAYVMPSRYEGFGLVLIEAMTCGLPCVSFDIKCGPKEIIEDGKNGYIVPYGDEDGMADRICRLIEDKVLAEKMSKNAIESVKRFDKDSIMKQWKEFFERVV